MRASTEGGGVETGRTGIKWPIGPSPVPSSGNTRCSASRSSPPRRVSSGSAVTPMDSRVGGDWPRHPNVHRRKSHWCPGDDHHSHRAPRVGSLVRTLTCPGSTSRTDPTPGLQILHGDTATATSPGTGRPRVRRTLLDRCALDSRDESGGYRIGDSGWAHLSDPDSRTVRPERHRRGPWRALAPEPDRRIVVRGWLSDVVPGPSGF